MAERRVSIVTGASQGIGRQIALALAARGDAVALAARQTARLAEVAEQIEQAGGESLVVRTDVTDPASVQEMAASVVGRFDRIDAVVANSGIGGPSGPLWELDAQEWERTFEGADSFTATLQDQVYALLDALLPYPGWFELKYDPEAGALTLTRAMQSRRDVPTAERFALYLQTLEQAGAVNRAAQADAGVATAPS